MSRHSPVIFRQRGDFKNMERFFRKDHKKAAKSIFDILGEKGVQALSEATPVRTGKTAASWRYVVEEQGDIITLSWHNDNITPNGDSIVKLLVRGHGTRDGHYVRGNNFVTPAIKPIFDEIADRAMAEVTK